MKYKLLGNTGLKVSELCLGEKYKRGTDSSGMAAAPVRGYFGHYRG